MARQSPLLDVIIGLAIMTGYVVWLVVATIQDIKKRGG